MQQTPTTPYSDTPAAVKQLVALYEHLTPAHLSQLSDYYAPDAHFKDPFNDVRGVPSIVQIFTHMFATLDQPRFIIKEQLVQGNQAFLAWEFQFRMRRWQPNVVQCIHGGTLVRFDAQARVIMHRDYWDAAEELYEKLPVLGLMMRWLRKTASATQQTPQTDRSPS